MSNGTTIQTCEKCFYFRDNKKYDLTCHKDPPTKDGSDWGNWPTVHKDDWCGEFKKKEAFQQADMFVGRCKKCGRRACVCPPAEVKTPEVKPDKAYSRPAYVQTDAMGIITSVDLWHKFNGKWVNIVQNYNGNNRLMYTDGVLVE